jgi:branched-chain amino acid transport system permease protein
MPLVFSRHHLNIVTELLIFGLFAMSLDVIVGYTGMISFGHAAFFGVGAYVSAFLLLQFSLPIPFALFGGAIASTIIAVPIGFLCTRSTGVYFAMLTLAFAQMIYAIVYKWYSVTGGSDGIAGIPRTTLWFEAVSLRSHTSFYYFVFVVVALSFFLCVKIMQSPFGKTLQAIRENEKKVETLGINTRRFRLFSFLIAAFFGGVAGSLFAPFANFASPEILFWLYSGTCIIMLVLGGVGTLLGPIVGAMIFILLEEILSSYTENWMVFLGIIFVFMVLFLPGGVVGFFSSLWAQRKHSDVLEVRN